MEQISESKFCSECGANLTPLLGFHLSRVCKRQNCGKTIYVQEWAEGGGLKAEAGDKLHIPAGTITMSLDPKHGHLTEAGLLSLLKQLFRGPELPKDYEGFIDFLKEQERLLDNELNQLEWIKHLDLFNPEDVNEAIAILEKENEYYMHVCFQSGSYGDAHRKFDNKDFEAAMKDVYLAHVFNCFAVINNEHFRKIVTFGYDCYHDLITNADNFSNSKKEQMLIAQLAEQIKQLDDSYLHVLINDGKSIAQRLKFRSIDEDTARQILIHEQQRRSGEKEIKKTEKDHSIRLFSIKSGIIISLLTVCAGLLGAWISK